MRSNLVWGSLVADETLMNACVAGIFSGGEGVLF